MKRTRTSSVLVVLLVGASLVACSSKSGAKADSSSSSAASDSTAPKPKSSSGSTTPSAVASASSAPKPSAPALDAKGPGPAVLSFSDGGVYLFDAGKMTKINDYSVSDATASKDGRIYVKGIESFVVAGGGNIEKLDSAGMDLTVAPDGTAWTVTFEKSIAKRNPDGTWAKEPVPGAESETLSHIALDAKGDIYVASMQKIFSKRGGTWSTRDVKELFKEASSPDSLYVSSLESFGGEVYVVTGSGVRTLDGKEMKVPAEYGYTSLSDGITASSDGTLAMHTRESILIVTTDGKVTEKKLAALQGVKGDSIDAFALDGQGRKWIGAGDQMYILDKDDKVLQTWPVGSTPGALNFVYVAGAGPELPPAPDPVVKANVKGRLLVDGAPVKGTEIVACGSPSMFITGATPCSGQIVELSGKTDDDGVFSFKDVPRGHYGLAWKEGGKWKLTLGMSGVCCTKIKNGEDFDMKDVQVKSN